ncbi:hypothetical protein [Paraburkholderia caribensis]|uniref:hypothetical protein n=1 Tax=Paraburkholderia caribensis TaxID=75105 RepID=UPI0015916C51|nr:hypothetical protein [Paraburkholderia caribensis]
MNFRSLRSQIESGAGQGHLDNYVPMWQLTRGNCTYFGVQATGPMPGYRRASCFRQRQDRIAALIALWIGGMDARENFPLWPFPHPHPLSDWPLGKPTERMCQGLMDLASDEHERKLLRRRAHEGYVPEATLNITYGERDCPQSCLLACVRATSKLAAAIPDSDGDIARAQTYAMANDMRFFRFDRRHFNRTLVSNLEVWSFSVNTIRRDVELDLVKRVEDLLLRRLEVDTPCNAVNLASSQLAIPALTAWTVLRYMQWQQTVDVDPRRYISHLEHFVPGGRAFRASLRSLILGVTP